MKALRLDAGLVCFGARDYDPYTGRWAARDPILFDGGQSNLFVYVGNEAVNPFDPTGLWTVGAFFDGIRSWGTSLVGEFVGSSMTLRVVDASAGTLNPIFQGEVLADDGGCRLVGTFRYDPSALAGAVLVCGFFFSFVAVLIWQMTHSLLVTPLTVACLLGVTLLRALPRINSQEETFRKALQTAGFASTELRSREAV